MAQTSKEKETITERGRLLLLEQFSELRDARNGTPPHSILCCAALQVRPAQCFALAPLAKKTLRLFVKCSSFVQRASLLSTSFSTLAGKPCRNGLKSWPSSTA